MRHILTVEPRQWSLVHPDDEDDETMTFPEFQACMDLGYAAEIFLTVDPAPTLFGRIVERILGPILPLEPGSYWISLGDDGNLHLGGVLSPAQELAYAGRLR